MKIIASFPYLRTTHPLAGSLWRPVVTVELSRASTRLQQLFFLDSGADITLLPASLGAALGLRAGEWPITSVRGLGAELTTLRLAEIQLQIGEARATSTRVGWADHDNVPALLGRLDIFDHYTFEFNHERRMVIVKQ